ncbi:cadherin repeat domain-containing protein [Aquimarina algiphila]|uniref:cadherin repeat domain-containing protein n=1 Tax=Aquimarina algiphila TaxID=2047982 RepID=UPI00232E2FB4|nr:cadherin domain-containing protein [Aquimarina algiphila]
MKTIKHTLYTFTLLLLITSCSKDDGPAGPLTPEPENPVAQNTAPELADQSFTVAENITDTTVIGTITATDTEEDALTYSLTTNSNDLFVLTETGELSLATGKLLNYDVAQTHTLTVEVTDGTNTTTANISIAITNTVDVYVVGGHYIGGHISATLWKNGIPTPLSTKSSNANSIYVSEDGDVYVTGWENNGTNKVATLWKNGEASYLSSKRSAGNDVYVSKGKVYVAGYNYNKNTKEATLWTNGSPATLAGTPPGSTEAFSVCVYNDNVYVSGKDYAPTLWVNTLPRKLDNNTGRVNEIFVVSKNKIIAVGGRGTTEAGSVATFWRGNESWNTQTQQEIQLGTSYGEIKSISYSKGNFYMIGYEKNTIGGNIPMLWENDMATVFSNDVSIKLRAISVFNDDVYIVGKKGNSATLWKNKEAIPLGYLEGENQNSTAFDVFVKL